MKYSLRSLMIVVMLVCVALGGVIGRVEYLRQQFIFHNHERERLYAVIRTRQDQGECSRIPLNEYAIHVILELRYENAITRPWALVDEIVSEEDLAIFKPTTENQLFSEEVVDQLMRRTLPKSQAPAPNPPKR